MARDNVGETIQRIRRQLASSFRYEVSTLTDALTASAGDVSVTLSAFPMSVIEGAVLSVGGEDLRVLTVDRPAKTCTVLRAWMDSTLEVHSVGDEVAINPRFTAFTILDAVRDEITSWGPDIFKVYGAPVSVAEGAQSFPLPVEFAKAYFIIEARHNITELQSTVWPQSVARVQLAPVGTWAAATASGFHIRLIDTFSGAASVFVLAALPFEAWTITAADDLVATVGIEPTQLELVDLGVKMRLLYDAENNASACGTQDDPRLNAEVSPGSAVGAARSIRQLYTRRRTEEQMKLRSRYPIRME